MTAPLRTRPPPPTTSAEECRPPLAACANGGCPAWCGFRLCPPCGCIVASGSRQRGEGRAHQARRAVARSSAATSCGSCRYPLTLRNWLWAASIPAAAQRGAICPLDQRFTRREWSRMIWIIDSIGLVDSTVVRRGPVIPSRVTVKVASSPSRKHAGSAGTFLGQAAGQGFQVGHWSVPHRGWPRRRAACVARVDVRSRADDPKHCALCAVYTVGSWLWART